MASCRKEDECVDKVCSSYSVSHKKLYDSLPLHGQVTRYLILRPGSCDDAVEVEMKVAELSRCSYEALSYTWGNRTRNRSIRINEEGVFAVTDNLWDALRRLRFQDRPRTLWIDAICINQGDVRERNGQVQRMYEIYRSAAKVIVWLGEPVETVMSAGHIQEQTMESTSDTEAFNTLDDVIGSMDSLWWERAWTVQEVLAGTSVEIRFGPHILPWSDLVLWLHEYQFVQYQTHPELDAQRMRLLEQCQRVKDLTRMRESGDYRFAALADITMTRSCLDPRDRVFSVLGL